MRSLFTLCHSRPKRRCRARHHAVHESLRSAHSRIRAQRDIDELDCGEMFELVDVDDLGRAVLG